MLEPITSAKQIFTEATNTLLAHSIRGTQNYFMRFSVSLDVRVVADTFGVIGLNSSRPSILQTRHLFASGGRLDTVIATIFIHRDANTHLARYCIAHSLFHLLLELEEFIQSGRGQWRQIQLTKAVDDKCNVFALELSRMHDSYLRDAESRNRSIYFPSGLFSETFDASAAKRGEWPTGFGFDPDQAFHKKK